MSSGTRRAAAGRAVPLGALLASLLAALLAGGCVSDGAVRLAFCLERAAGELERAGTEELKRPCDLKVPGRAVVVAFPAEAISRAELEAEGLSPEEIATVGSLQLLDHPYERLNVVPAGRRPRPSRTTYQRRFVELPRLLVCRVEDGEVAVRLARRNGRVLLTGLE